MGRFEEDIRHQLKVIARAQSMIKKAQERLAVIAEAVAAEGVGRPPSSPPELPASVRAECEEARERVRKVMQAPGYVPKYQ